MQLLILPDGTIRAVYDEAVDLTVLGPMSIARASHVEPTLEALWTADLSPLRGPVLGPFANRSLALEAERRWLEEHWLTADV